MNAHFPMGRISDLIDWLKEKCISPDEQRFSRERLASLTTRQAAHESDLAAEMVLEMLAQKRIPYDDEKDNSLRSQLVHEDQSRMRKHSQEVVTHWLQHGPDCRCPIDGENSDDCQVLACGHQDYRCADTELVDFENGVGMERDCLSCFLEGDLKAAETRLTRQQQITATDLPAYKSLNFRRLESQSKSQPVRKLLSY